MYELSKGCLDFSITEEKCDFSLGYDVASLSLEDVCEMCSFTLKVICTVAETSFNNEPLMCKDGELTTSDGKQLYVLRWDIS